MSNVNETDDKLTDIMVILQGSACTERSAAEEVNHHRSLWANSVRAGSIMAKPVQFVGPKHIWSDI